MKRLTKADINQLLAPRNIELLGEYVNAKTKTLFIDNTCGHAWTVAFDGVQQGTGCPYCSNNSLVHGVGDNDLRLTSKDPLYIVWKSMLGRCYSPKIHEIQPEYTGITCHPDWHKVSKFVEWAKLQDWQGKYLDKDLLVLGNKQYGPDTCVFVTALVNSLAQVSRRRTKNLPRGVHESGKKFQAEYNKEYLGRYTSPEEAHAVYVCRRNSELTRIAAIQTDVRIQNALLNRRT